MNLRPGAHPTAPVDPKWLAEACEPYPNRIANHEISIVIEQARAAGVFDLDDTAVAFYNVDRFIEGIASLKEHFPPSALHTIAVKANPLIALLKLAAALGLGAEVASQGELELAREANIDYERVVFDSPVKTPREIRRALSRPLLLNANSEAELHRILGLITPASSARIGLRVNPLVGFGEIDATSTATYGSKFGVPLPYVDDALAPYLAGGGRLDALHVHIGSQGMSLEQLVAACVTAYDLFVRIRSSIPTLTTLDIGGGLPVSYSSSQFSPSFEAYASALHTAVPGLWSRDLSVVTEFGRALHANNGWVASRIEYILAERSDRTLVTHVGADMFLRTCYQPDLWGHEFLVTSESGEVRTGDFVPWQIAGPLCFSGDFLARDAQLPSNLKVGDLLVVRDTGAYTSSMWSVYNSRQMPKTIGYRSSEGFSLLGAREDIADIIRRWNV